MVDTAPTDTKQVFRQCGTCSQAFGHLVNRAFEHPAADAERALTSLAGGIKNHGHQCGMLWGSVLGVGAEAARRCDDPSEGTGVAMAASQRVLASFVERSGTADCREITGRRLDRVVGLVGFMIETMAKGMDNSPCFELAEDWAPEALEAATKGLDQGAGDLERPALSCASQVVKQMDGSDEDAVTVAGFAGGIGLSGGGCGALGAAIWKKGLDWSRAHPGKQPGLLSRLGDKQVLAVFERATGGEFRCEAICGRRFASVDEHSAYVEGGGCSELIEALAEA